MIKISVNVTIRVLIHGLAGYFVQVGVRIIICNLVKIFIRVAVHVDFDQKSVNYKNLTAKSTFRRRIRQLFYSNGLGDYLYCSLRRKHIRT